MADPRTIDQLAGYEGVDRLGRALRGVRRESLEIFTKVYWPTGNQPQATWQWRDA
jgi:hypothetical protein